MTSTACREAAGYAIAQVLCLFAHLLIGYISTRSMVDHKGTA